jgi:hypothetical protein
MLQLRPRDPVHRRAHAKRSLLAAVRDRRLGECCSVRTVASRLLSTGTLQGRRMSPSERDFKLTEPVDIFRHPADRAGATMCHGLVQV